MPVRDPFRRLSKARRAKGRAASAGGASEWVTRLQPEPLGLPAQEDQPFGSSQKGRDGGEGEGAVGDAVLEIVGDLAEGGAERGVEKDGVVAEAARAARLGGDAAGAGGPEEMRRSLVL